MRVAHVITRLIVGGAQENTIASVLGLRQKPGLQVDLISGPTTGPEGSLVSSFEYRVSSSESAPPSDNSKPETRNQKLTIVPELIRPVHPLKDSIALRKLERIFHDTRPNIVHTHSGKAGVLGRLAAARAGVPVIIHTIHGPSFGNFQGALANFTFRAAERYAARVTTHFVTVADAMRDQYLAAGIGRPEQYTRIFSGFNLTPFLHAANDLSLRAKYGLSPHDFVIGKIARLFKLKGHNDLFDIAPELVRQNPRIKFLLVGDGEWRGRFERMAADIDLKQHFVFTGLVPPAEIPALVGIMDIVVHLSLREGLARALPQALAAGKPVIAYACDGAGEVCRDRETGFLIPPGDHPLLTRRLLELAANGSLREQFGAAGRRYVREHFAVERMVDELHRLYLRLAPTS